MNEAEKLRREIADADRRAQELKNRLAATERDCAHNWSKPVYNPIVQEAYTDPGDPPGTMGIDWRGPCYVPRKETKRWTRTCSKCGKVEHTQSVNTQTTEIPRF